GRQIGSFGARNDPTAQIFFRWQSSSQANFVQTRADVNIRISLLNQNIERSNCFFSPVQVF
ncbi:MAG: hypothetical protein MN733_37210, partial [Nitrososphaera sp.]|nr:hypothetical protein [Nitrososphaera sp.]